MKTAIEIQRYIDLLCEHRILLTTEQLHQLLTRDLLDLASSLSAIAVLKWCLSDSPNPSDPGPLYAALQSFADEAGCTPYEDPPIQWRRRDKKTAPQDHSGSSV